MRTKFFFSLFIGIIFFTRQGFVSQLGFKETSLKNVVESSSQIFLGIPKKSKSKDHDTFVIWDILKSEDSTKKDESIDVVGANNDLFEALSEHQKKFGTAGMPSVDLDTYKPSLEKKDFKEETLVLLFLTKNRHKQLRYVLDNSWESIAQLPTVLDILKKPKSTLSEPDFCSLVATGTADQIRLELLKGANANGKDNLGGVKCIFFALDNKHPLEALKLLIQFGANPNERRNLTPHGPEATPFSLLSYVEQKRTLFRMDKEREASLKTVEAFLEKISAERFVTEIK